MQWKSRTCKKNLSLKSVPVAAESGCPFSSTGSGSSLEAPEVFKTDLVVIDTDSDNAKICPQHGSLLVRRQVGAGISFDIENAINTRVSGWTREKGTSSRNKTCTNTPADFD